jgi:hypothetical protein
MVEQYPVSHRELLEEAVKRLNRLYFSTHPERSIKRISRTRKTCAKVRIEHCSCGKPHTLSFAKVRIDIDRESVAFRCPVSNRESEARV